MKVGTFIATQTLTFLQPGDVQGIWKQDRLGRSLPHLIEIIIGLKTAGVGFRAPTEPLDTATPHRERWFALIEAPAQHQRALTPERIPAGLTAARRRGRHGGRPRALDMEKLAASRAALAHGTSQAAVCRTFGMPRSPLYETLGRSGD